MSYSCCLNDIGMSRCGYEFLRGRRQCMVVLLTPRVVPYARLSLDPHVPNRDVLETDAPVLSIFRMLEIGCVNELN